MTAGGVVSGPAVDTDEPLTVHAPLARWATERAAHLAIDDGERSLTFAALQAEVTRRAATLDACGAPVHRLIDPQAATVEQLVDFLATVASGRCAAVGDPDWPAATLAAVRETLAALPSPSPSPVTAPGPTTPFYIGHTSGSTGVPKGYRRHHRSWTESFRAALATFGPDAAGPILAPGRISHSLFLFGMLLGLWTGAGVVVQPRFSAARALDTLRRGRASCLVAVPSQLLMLIEHAARRQLAPIEATRLVLISGAPWARPRTPELQALFPHARLIEFYGASETSFIAWQPADAATPAAVVGRPFAGVEVEIRDGPEGPGRTTGGGADRPGRIHVRSAMLFSDYVGQPDPATAAIRTVDARGEWLSVRDRGHLDAQGRLWLHGRENRMLVTQGKNLFPEAVEAVLEGRPGVRAASVLGRPDAIRGREVVALIEPAPDAPRPTTADLTAACRAALEPHKVPRRWWLVTGDWPRTPSGKTDHGALAERLAAALDGSGSAEATAWLRPLS